MFELITISSAPCLLNIFFYVLVYTRNFYDSCFKNKQNMKTIILCYIVQEIHKINQKRFSISGSIQYKHISMFLIIFCSEKSLYCIKRRLNNHNTFKLFFLQNCFFNFSCNLNKIIYFSFSPKFFLNTFLGYMHFYTCTEEI